MNAQYNWIDIMEQPQFDFIASITMLFPDYDYIVSEYFDTDANYGQLNGIQRERWVILNQMMAIPSRNSYTVRNLLQWLEDTFDEDTGEMLPGADDDDDESVEDHSNPTADVGDPLLPDGTDDGFVEQIEDIEIAGIQEFRDISPAKNREPTECPICYENKVCHSPVDWNTNALCCHSMCIDCLDGVTASSNHNCPQCRRDLHPWLLFMKPCVGCGNRDHPIYARECGGVEGCNTCTNCWT